MTKITIGILALALLVAACAPTDTTTPDASCAAVTCPAGIACVDGKCVEPEPTVCPEERQEACTREYMPVCGRAVLNTGVESYQTYGNACSACAEMKVVDYVPGECTPEQTYVACPEERPEICTMEYNPVCARVDNGIRCITQPCDSEDLKTYSTGCTACADPKVYGYTPGECAEEVDNNPADDEVPPCAATLCEYGSTCVEGVGCVPQDGGRLAFTECQDPRPEVCTLEYLPVCAVHRDDSRTTAGNACGACGDPSVVGYWPGECENPPSDTPKLSGTKYMLCTAGGEDRTEFAAQFDYTCVDECPEGMDAFGAQIGMLCIQHYGEAEIMGWAACETRLDCPTETQCALATHTTDGQEFLSASERCVPNDYADYLINTVGLTSVDENGERTTAIA